MSITHNIISTTKCSHIASVTDKHHVANKFAQLLLWKWKKVYHISIHGRATVIITDIWTVGVWWRGVRSWWANTAVSLRLHSTHCYSHACLSSWPAWLAGT